MPHHRQRLVGIPRASHVAYWPSSTISPTGRARQLCPSISDVDFLRNLNGVINLDAKIAHRALNLGVAEQKLHRS